MQLISSKRSIRENLPAEEISADEDHGSTGGTNTGVGEPGHSLRSLVAREFRATNLLVGRQLRGMKSLKLIMRNSPDMARSAKEWRLFRERVYRNRTDFAPRLAKGKAHHSALRCRSSGNG